MRAPQMIASGSDLAFTIVFCSFFLDTTASCLIVPKSASPSSVSTGVRGGATANKVGSRGGESPRKPSMNVTARVICHTSCKASPWPPRLQESWKRTIETSSTKNEPEPQSPRETTVLGTAFSSSTARSEFIDAKAKVNPTVFPFLTRKKTRGEAGPLHDSD